VSESFEFSDPGHVLPGAVGQPGQRTFFLQAREGVVTGSFKVEKQQVAALCEYLGGILADLPPVDAPEPVEATGVEEPIALAWVVGRLAVAYEEADDRIVVVAEEFLDIPDDDLEALDLDDPATLLAAGYEPATARFRLTRAQVASFIAVGEELVQSGRPQCRLCGQPIDPEGHACPRLN
jgi:uncharacterized repeat protein (TIGR03847 family)